MQNVFDAFGKKGVPPRDQALAALGVEKAKKGLERERKGAKGLDEIGLSAKERLEAEIAEQNIWDEQRFYAWIDSLNEPRRNRKWAEESFTFSPNGEIVFKRQHLDLTGNAHLKELPPNLVAPHVYVSRTGLERLPDEMKANEIIANNSPNIRSIPLSLKVRRLNVSSTRITTFSPNIEIDTLELGHCKIKEIPEAIKHIKFLDLSGTRVESLPQDTGSLEEICVDKKQETLAESARAHGITVTTFDE